MKVIDVSLEFLSIFKAMIDKEQSAKIPYQRVTMKSELRELQSFTHFPSLLSKVTQKFI